MDKRKSILNVGVSVGFRIVTIVMAIIAKRFLIQICGNEVNGLNALYISIADFLTVADLGIGTAITFCMYKPIVQGDHKTVSALYHLFKRLYLVIGGVILVCGLAITPFIHIFARDYAQLDVNLYTSFILVLVSVVISYLFGAQISLFIAYKNNYITTTINSGGIVIQNVLQIIVLLTTRSFTWYLLCRIIAVFLQWIAADVIARKNYYLILSNKQKLDKDIQKELTKNIKAMFMHKVGILLVDTADSIIISMFIGVVMLGKFSNYTMIMNSMTSVIRLVFTSLTSILGHLYAKKSKDVVRSYCEVGHLLNFWIGVLFYLGYYAIVDNLIAILFSEELIVAKSISVVITVNGFVQFIRQNALAFREATGTFYNDRWKPLIEGVVNIILSIMFVKRIGVVGVIVATIITNLLICHIVEPYVIYKNAFAASPRMYYLKNYGMISIFIISLFLLNHCMQSFSNQWKELFVNGCISVVISMAACAAAVLFNMNTFRYAVKKIKKE